MQKKTNEKISHLTIEQINELIERYYGDEKIKDLLEEYQIDITTGKLYALFPEKKSENTLCPYCKVAVYQRWISRTDSRWRKRRIGNRYCIECGHKLDEYCRCDGCRQQEAERLEEKRLMVEKQLNRKRELVYHNFGNKEVRRKKLEDLSTIDKIYLGCLMQCALSEDMQIIEPLYTKQIKLAPTEKLSEQILDELYKKEIIVVDINSNLNAFDSEGESFDKYGVFYNININEEDFTEIISTIFWGKCRIEPEECLEVWQELALSEVMEYLAISMKRIDFEFSPGKKTVETFSKCLEDFSVSQVYHIIYSSIAKAAKYFQECRVSRRQAANSVITNCESYYERAVSEQWKLTCYNRDKDCPESAMSKYLYGKIIKLGREGIDVVPSIDKIFKERDS